MLDQSSRPSHLETHFSDPEADVSRQCVKTQNGQFLTLLKKAEPAKGGTDSSVL